MTRVYCDGCKSEIPKGDGFITFPYGRYGVTVMPMWARSRKIEPNLSHYCSGRCFSDVYFAAAKLMEPSGAANANAEGNEVIL